MVQPNPANGIAVYGGQGATVSGNVVQDTNALGGGILVANRFGSTPLTDEFVLENNTTIRAGALDPNWNFGVGALWFDARDTAISGATIRVSGFRAVDSPYEAFQFIDGTVQASRSPASRSTGPQSTASAPSSRRRRPPGR